ncbi:MAG: hypothetical protein DCC68_05140 [Planctomycetota bacterium]|nr:MAG: hypothetical protein DCC68_05140 [Planctomycetota bacterium]
MGYLQFEFGQRKKTISDLAIVPARISFPSLPGRNHATSFFFHPLPRAHTDFLAYARARAGVREREKEEREYVYFPYFFA